MLAGKCPDAAGGITARQSWQNYYGVAADGSYSNGKTLSNTNAFLAGFNPTNTAAYPHIISMVKSGNDMNITYLGANGDTSYAGGPAAGTNVLQAAADLSLPNNFVGLQTNVYTGGSGLGTNVTATDPNGATNIIRFYRVQVLVR